MNQVTHIANIPGDEPSDTAVLSDPLVVSAWCDWKGRRSIEIAMNPHEAIYLSIEGGTALQDAITKAINYIKETS